MYNIYFTYSENLWRNETYGKDKSNNVDLYTNPCIYS